MPWLPFPLALSLALAATAGLAADSPLRPEQMRQAMGLKLGAWKTKTRLVVMDIEPWPGGDRAEAEKAARRGRALMTDRTVQHQCLEDKPGRLSFPGLHPPPGCEFTRIEVRNGRLAVSSLCRYPGLDGAFTQAVEGTYTSERVILRGHAMLPHPRGRLRMKVESESRFAGSCDSLPPDTLPGGGGLGQAKVQVEPPSPVGPEPVEGPSFLFARESEDFDKLSQTESSDTEP